MPLHILTDFSIIILLGFGRAINLLILVKSEGNLNYYLFLIFSGQSFDRLVVIEREGDLVLDELKSLKKMQEKDEVFFDRLCKYKCN